MPLIIDAIELFADTPLSPCAISPFRHYAAIIYARYAPPFIAAAADADIDCHCLPLYYARHAAADMPLRAFAMPLPPP